MKDMPGEMPLGLEIACIPLREDPRDALITRNGERLADLKPGAVVGTSSLRRQAQLRAARPDLQIAEMRGNLDTRLRKLDSGECDAIALACAGLNRLGMAERISQALDIALCCPAVGQGALALEARSDNDTLKELLNALHHPQTADAIAAERAFLQRLEGGCSIPAGALATVADDLLHIQGVLAAPDGSRILTAQERGSRAQAKEMGRALADALLAKGGADLLKG
jgi:hydroxymethylbilane synthase